MSNIMSFAQHRMAGSEGGVADAFTTAIIVLAGLVMVAAQFSAI